jgi:hypothetical protein
MLAGGSSGLADELQPILLPKPETDGGKSVLAALWERRTTRDIKEDKLPPQVLSNLLWAAFGVNRETGPFGQPGRTAASASNSQEIDHNCNKPELAAALKLRPEQRVLFAQTVGYPARS